MTDGAIVGALLFALGGLAGLLLARYHYRDALSEQAHCIVALEAYIDSHSEREASAEDLGYDG
jgi:hypothetical protein